MIRYLYYESTETSLIGIMRMISFIIDSFRLGVNKSLLQIWVVEMLQIKGHENSCHWEIVLIDIYFQEYIFVAPTFIIFVDWLVS